MVTVVIPWRPAPSRIAAFETVTDWYREALPHAEIVTIDSDDEVFCLARCRNLGVRSADGPGEVVVIADADTIPQVEPLRSAIQAAATSGLVHLPYTEYRWLGEDGTARFAAGAPLEECEFELVRGACSGVYVTTAETWQSHGGQDERFRGWGFEDAAWYIAHDTVLGLPPQRHPGRVFALHHRAERRDGAQYEANVTLMQRYRDAAGDIAAMRQLVGEPVIAE